MRVFLIGKHADDLVPLLDRYGIERVAAGGRPDVIMTYGGDGTLIGAESDHPGVPKLALRDERSCHKCEQHEDERVIARLAAGDLATTELMKLVATVGAASFTGMNDVLLRNEDIRSAVRFSVYVNQERVTDEIIGDGLVTSTPFGSSAYFRSITNTTFRTGIGLAFNNCTEFLNHLVLREEDEVRVHIVRGPAQLTSDNHQDIAKVASEDDILIRRADETGKVLEVGTLRCMLCRYKHAPRRRF